MAKKGNTKKALLMSALSLLLCVSMLVGTTFAWFTDEVVSGQNIIAAGNLDVELTHRNNTNKNDELPEKVSGATDLFKDVARWEPGAVAYENFTVSNVGTLDLKYLLALNFTDENAVKTDGKEYALSQALKVAVVEDGVDTSKSREEIVAGIAANKWQSLATFSLSGKLYDKADVQERPSEKTYGVVIYWEPSENDNNWNVNNGKTTTDGSKELRITLGVKLEATQLMSESDSFGPDYDSLANKWDGTVGEVPAEQDGVIIITTGEELAAFASAVNNGNTYKGKTVKLGADINLGNQAWTPIGDCNSGKYFQGTFDGQSYTIYNLSVDKSSDPDEHSTAGLFGWVDAAKATVKNVKLENATIMGSHWVGAIAGYFTGRIENCSVNNSTITGFNVNDDANGDKIGGIVGCLNEHSYINNNSVINTEITGNRDIGGIAGSVAASTYEMKNNKVENTILCYSAEKSYASAGALVSGRTGYVPDSTNTVTNVTITRVINVNAVAELNEALAGLSGEALNTAAILHDCNELDGIVNIPAAYTGTLTIKDSTIKSVQAAGNANIVIVGDVVVNAKGSGVATVAENENTIDGSAITANGELNISGNGNLTAIAADEKAAFGIGGVNVTKLTIENVHIVDVKGGYVQPLFKNDFKYGKNEPEGGAAIGSGCNGAVITLNNVTIDNAQGGSKAAGIGARYHTGVTININNSTIKNVEGGNASAGIGGSRVSDDVAPANQHVKINITNSTIKAIGGQFGAGIGSGYDTHCGEKNNEPFITATICTINIDAASNITAQGGQYAAGVGTGYHVAGLAGNIQCEVNATPGESREKYTIAQAVGFGVVDRSRELSYLTVAPSITYQNVEITVPDVVRVSTAAELAEKVAAGVTNIWLNDGEYDVSGCGGKTLTISGTKKAVIKPMNEGEDGCDYGFGSAGTGIGNITFNGVTIDTSENTGNYKGFAYMKGTFNDCSFVGAYSINNANDFVFNRCIFDFKNGYFWTWGAKSVTFNECIFNGNSKAILAHGWESTVININNCKFAATEKGYASNGTVWTSAIEIDPAGTNTYTINISDSTINENYSGWTRIKDESNGHIISMDGYVQVSDAESLATALTNGGKMALNGIVDLGGDSGSYLNMTQDVTITGGTIKGVGYYANEMQNYAVNATSGNIVFDGVTFELTDSDIKNGGWGRSVNVSGTANVTFRNCTFKGTQCLIYQSGADSVVTLEGCTFDTTSVAIQSEIYSGDFQLGQDLIIKNCDFTGVNDVLHIYDYDKDPSSEAIAQYLTDNGNTFTGTCKQTCQ